MKGAAPAVLPVPGRRVVRVGRVSGALPLRAIAVGLTGLLITITLAVFTLGRGDLPISPTEVFDVLAGGGTRAQRYVLVELRLPRVLCALLVGAALAVAGALTQTFARNPLASPDILGVTSGAATGAVAAIVLGGAGGGFVVAGVSLGVPMAALAGAAISATVVYLFAWRRGIDGYRLVLIGLGVGEVLTAATSWFLVRAEIVDATRATIWLSGSLAGRGWEQVRPLSLALLVLLPAALAVSFQLRALQFGDDTAKGLGVRLSLAQFGVVAVAVALAGAAVAAAGPVEFVAFVVPQIALRLCGGGRPPLVVSGILGALLVVGADLVARDLGRSELPVGLVTSVIGAPYLLWLLVRGTRRTT